MSVASAIAGGGAGGGGGGTVTTTGGTSTDNAIARFDGTDGTKIQDSAVFIDDSANITGIQNLTATGDLNAAGGTVSAHEVYTTAGTLTAVAHGFTGDLNTGLYSPGADQAAVVTGGTARLTVSTTAITSTLPVVNPAGAIATPSVTTAGDLDTGVYFPAANTVAVAAGGVDAARFLTTASGVDYLTFASGASTANAVIASAGPAGAIGITLAPQTNGPVLLSTTGALQFGGTSSAFPELIAKAGEATMRIEAADGSTHGNLIANLLALTDGSSTSAFTIYINPATANPYITQRSTGVYSWQSGTNAGAVSPDLGFSRVAASVVGIGTGAPASTAGWYTYAGASRMTTDVTNNTTTFGAMTGLSATLIAGRSYIIRLRVKCINSAATEGIKFDFNGGTATATDFWMGAGILSSGGTDVVGTNIATALNGAINFTTFTGESVVVFEGYIKCNAGGTLIPEFAENSTAVGTATARKGSTMDLIDTV